MERILLLCKKLEVWPATKKGAVTMGVELGRVHSQISQRIQTHKSLAGDACDVIAMEMSEMGK